MSSAIPGLCGSCQNRLHDPCLALSRLMTAMLPSVARKNSISMSFRSFMGSAEAFLEASEAGLEQRGYNRPDDNIRLPVWQILRSPLDRAAGTLWLHIQRSRVIRDWEATDTLVAIGPKGRIHRRKAFDNLLAVNCLDTAQLPDIGPRQLDLGNQRMPRRVKRPDE